MIATWPGVIEAGTENDHISAFWDYFPTFAEIAGAELPTTQGCDGLSMLPALKGEVQATHPYLYWEFPEYGGQQALRMGKWKAIIKNMQKGNQTIELFDLETDLQEQNDIAADHPALIDSIQGIFLKEHRPSVFERWQITALDGEK